jgi:hypothetical protein
MENTHHDTKGTIHTNMLLLEPSDSSLEWNLLSTIIIQRHRDVCIRLSWCVPLVAAKCERAAYEVI